MMAGAQVKSFNNRWLMSKSMSSTMPFLMLLIKMHADAGCSNLQIIDVDAQRAMFDAHCQ